MHILNKYNSILLASMLFLSCRVTASQEQLFLSQQKIEDNHRILSQHVNSTYEYVESNPTIFNAPPKTKFVKKKRITIPFDFKQGVNLCVAGVQEYESRDNNNPIFKPLCDENNNIYIFTSTSIGQWRLEEPNNSGFHIISWPLDKNNYFMSIYLIQDNLLKSYYSNLNLEMIHNDDSPVGDFVKAFFSTSISIIERLGEDFSGYHDLEEQERAHLKNLNKLIEKCKMFDINEDEELSQYAEEWGKEKCITFLRETYHNDEHRTKRVYIEYIVTDEIEKFIKNNLINDDIDREIYKYCYLSGINRESYTSLNDPLNTLINDSNSDTDTIVAQYRGQRPQHSESLLSWWLFQNKDNFESLGINPSAQVFFLHTHGLTCAPCEKISHCVISNKLRLPLLISFTEKRAGSIQTFSRIPPEINKEFFMQLVGFDGPLENEDDFLVRIPIQFQIT
jgi:hypothetical protein